VVQLANLRLRVTVNSVAPGPVETGLFRSITPAGSEAERIFLAQIPMRRFAKPEEIAAAATFVETRLKNPRQLKRMRMALKKLGISLWIGIPACLFGPLELIEARIPRVGCTQSTFGFANVDCVHPTLTRNELVASPLT
jgi:hypothetical protein